MSQNRNSSSLAEFFDPLIIKREQENFGDIMQSVRDGITFRGTNLWVLIFAILIASIGLNINSAVVIIGAMLISPLMGPIIGIGVGIAINDSVLVKRSIRNIIFAVAVSLIASMLYFLLSPLEEAHSELLARISPTIWDVLIAFFGGLAGMIAIVSQKKGNVIPGVAIATALMPPLCTAGYGLATGKTTFIFGALFLFFINAVFITVSALIVVRFLQFPYREFPDESERRQSRNIIALIVIITLIPSIYFGYNQIRENQFMQSANAFIEHEAQFPDDYLLKKTIDPKSQEITLVYGGKIITEEQIAAVRDRLGVYGIEHATLNIKQGFASLYETKKSDAPIIPSNQGEIDKLTLALAEHESKLAQLEEMENTQSKRTQSILSEIQILEPAVAELALESGTLYASGSNTAFTLALVQIQTPMNTEQQETLTLWLKERIKDPQLHVIFRVHTPDVEESTLEESVTDGVSTGSGTQHGTSGSGTSDTRDNLRDDRETSPESL